MQTLDNTHKDQVTVEAETVEDALAEISTQLGTDAEIMRAQKVHRGGVGGFFAKEMVQLTARRRRRSGPRQPDPRPRTAPTGGGIAEVLERMAQDADAADGDFRTALRRELSTEPLESGSEGFLAAVGWEPTTGAPATQNVQDAVENAVPAADEPVIPEVVSSFAATADEVPEPVVVGPAIAAAPVFPPEQEEPPMVPAEVVAQAEAIAVVAPAQEEPAEEEPVVAPQLVPDETGAPIGGTVVPTEFPVKPDLDTAAHFDEEEPQADNSQPPTLDWRTATVDDAPVGMGTVDWSTTALLRLGLPAPVIGAVSDLDPTDDFGWIDRIAAAVAPHCGPLPGEDVIVVGPHAERLAEPLGLPLIHSGDMAPYAGSFCAMVEDSTRDRTWLEFVQGGRGIHLVIGDEPWQDLLVGEPVAVSWVGEHAVSDALYLAFTLGATLGYGTVDGFVSSMVRAQPTDVALAIRRIVGRR